MNRAGKVLAAALIVLWALVMFVGIALWVWLAIAPVVMR